MTEENLRKLYKHYSWLATGDFTRRDFDTESESSSEDEEEGGHMNMGKLTVERINLIKSKALVNKAEMEEKYPALFKKTETPKPKEEKPLSKMNKDELIKICDEKEIELEGDETKAQILELIEELD